MRTIHAKNFTLLKANNNLPPPPSEFHQKTGGMAEPCATYGGELELSDLVRQGMEYHHGYCNRIKEIEAMGDMVAKKEMLDSVTSNLLENLTNQDMALSPFLCGITELLIGQIGDAKDHSTLEHVEAALENFNRAIAASTLSGDIQVIGFLQTQAGNEMLRLQHQAKQRKQRVLSSVGSVSGVGSTLEKMPSTGRPKDSHGEEKPKPLKERLWKRIGHKVKRVMGGEDEKKSAAGQ
ncbi:hypothetical protein LZ554_004967 [Drepanopeziza brunnea f. sp. 'monogermtubi']|nr:hypothetical protein LZ554_004967 [Drepanopeziza brunnea f. sp. 'monogermtubi']